MKTAEQFLKDNDCLQSSTNNMDDRIISTDKQRFIKAMKEYAHQTGAKALEDAADNAEIERSQSLGCWIIPESILQTEIKLP